MHPFNLMLDYPSYEEEIDIVKSTTVGKEAEVNAVLSPEEILYFQQLIYRVPVPDNVYEYAVNLVAKTQNNLKKEDLGLDKKIKEYQNSLVVYAYETQLINQKLDTLVSDSEIEAYYEDNKANFQLRNNMVKAAYVILDLNNANKESFRKLLSDKDTLMLQNLDVMANYYAVSSYLNVDAWIRLDDLTHIIPIEILNAESFLKKNKFVALDDADYSYMVRFVDYLLEETVAPLELVKDDIKNVILTQRKKDLLDRMKASIYEKAKKEHAFEVYVGMPALDNAD